MIPLGFLTGLLLVSFAAPFVQPELIVLPILMVLITVAFAVFWRKASRDEAPEQRRSADFPG